MAGSYNHVMSGWSSVENMGDAKESVEELLWLVQEGIGDRKACELLASKFYPMRRGEKDEDSTYIDVKKMMNK